MHLKNDEWIAKIQELEAEIKTFQATPDRTGEVKLALR